MTSVSIILCTRNRADSLRRTLAAMDALDVPVDMSVELIVVDNGSTDDTAAVIREARIRKMNIRYLAEPKAGLSRATNLGLAAAGGDIIITTSDDVIPSPDWIAKLCAPILNGTAEAVTGCICLAPHILALAPWMTPRHRSYLADTVVINHSDPEYLVGANMAFSRKVLERVPAYDLELGPGGLGCCEETLFSYQLKAAGYRIVYAPDAVIEHHPREDRLAPRHWIKAVSQNGRCAAYILYHWDHGDIPHPYRMAWDALRHIAHLWFEATRVRWEPTYSEDYVSTFRKLHLALQFIRERKRPRNYTKCGLVKLTAPRHLSPSGPR